LNNIITKINFLNKLNKEGKLELIDLNEEMKESYMLKSESNLISSKILLNNEKLEREFLMEESIFKINKEIY